MRGDVSIGEHLTGGHMSGVARVGDRVHCAAGAWTPTVHRLLRHLHDRGVTGIPQPLGLDADGREMVTCVPGPVPQDPARLGLDRRRARRRRPSSGRPAPRDRDFDLRDSHWRSPSHQPVEVVCHDDFAPYNLVFDGAHELTA